MKRLSRPLLALSFVAVLAIVAIILILFRQPAQWDDIKPGMSRWDFHSVIGRSQNSIRGWDNNSKFDSATKYQGPFCWTVFVFWDANRVESVEKNLWANWPRKIELRKIFLPRGADTSQNLQITNNVTFGVAGVALILFVTVGGILVMRNTMKLSTLCGIAFAFAAGTLISSCKPSGTGRGASDARLTRSLKWENKINIYHTTNDPTSDLMAEGANGWELVSVHVIYGSNGIPTITAGLKRPLQ